MILHIADCGSGNGDAGAMSLSRLLSLCGDVEEGGVLAALSYWMQKGVIRELRESGGSSSSGDGSRCFEVVESQAALAVLDSSTLEEDGQMDMVRLDYHIFSLL